MSEPPVRAPLVTVRGVAQREVAPDLATLGIAVHAAGSSADAVRSELAAASARLTSLLADFRTAIEQSGTSGLHIAPEFNRRSPTKITGYRGSFRASVVLHDFAALSDLVLGTGGLGESQVDGPWWSLRPDSPAFRDVRLDAIADARRRAEDYAEAFGTSLGTLVEVSDLETAMAGGAVRAAAYALGRGGGEPAFDFEPSLQTVSGQVTVRFTLASVSGM